MQENILYLVRLNNKIFRSTQSYLDNVLKEYELTSGSYPYLLILRQNEGISQNEISKQMCCDRAMSGRTIKKLVILGYLNRMEDTTDARAYKIYLTKKAKTIIPKVLDKIHTLASLITKDLNEEEKIIMITSLNKVLDNIK